MEHGRRGGLPKAKLYLALLLGAVARGLHVGRSEANGGEVHIGNLSGTASLVVIVVGVAVAGLFIGFFALRWRQTAQSSRAQPEEGDADRASELESGDEV